MPFSTATLQELRAELERLLAQRASLDARVAALQSLLGRDTPSQRQILTAGGTGTVFQTVMPPIAPVGLRDRIRAALHGSDGRKAGDVADAVVASGYTSEGKTDVKVRVYNELYRMKKLRLVRRTVGGKFTLATELNENGQ